MINNYYCYLLNTRNTILFSLGSAMPGRCQYLQIRKPSLWRVMVLSQAYDCAVLLPVYCILSPSGYLPVSLLRNGGLGEMEIIWLCFPQPLKIPLKRPHLNISLYILPEVFYTHTGKECVNMYTFCSKQSWCKLWNKAFICRVLTVYQALGLFLYIWSVWVKPFKLQTDHLETLYRYLNMKLLPKR